MTKYVVANVIMTDPRFRVASFGLDCLGNCTGWFVEDTNIRRTQLSDQRVSPLFIGNIYEPDQRQRARERAFALADKLNRVYAAVVRQDNMTRAEISEGAPHRRLTDSDYAILGDRAYGSLASATATARALHAPEYIYSVNL